MAAMPSPYPVRPALRPGAQIGNTCASRFPMNSGTRPLTSAGVIRFPLDEGEWQDAEDSEIVAEGACPFGAPPSSFAGSRFMRETLAAAPVRRFVVRARPTRANVNF